MIKYFVKAWENNKENLREYFKNNKQEEYCNSYEDILKAIIDNVLNKENIKFVSDDTDVIDYGDYQGTQIITFHVGTYQPTVDDTFYTSVYYGSCSGCDTLQAIRSWDDDKLPTEEQLNDYMELALDMIQNIKCFGNVEGSEISLNK